MVIPFLGILFETQEKVYNPQALSLSADAIKNNFYAIISSIIDERGKVEALLFICVLVLTLARPRLVVAAGYQASS